MNHYLVLAGLAIVAFTHLLMLMWPAVAKRVGAKVHAYSNLAGVGLVLAGTYREMLESFGYAYGGGGGGWNAGPEM